MREHVSVLEDDFIDLTELISQNKTLPTGDLTGNCVFCGKITDKGFKAKLKSNFTAYSYLQGGTVICPECNHLYLTSLYRFSMWVVNKHEFKTFKRAEGKNIILNPPEPPFMIYFTKTWKKQGWIMLMNKMNYNKDKFVVGFDYNIINVDIKTCEGYLNLIATLIGSKITKTEILTGNFTSKTIDKKLNMDFDLIKKIRMTCDDPLWELCVFLS